MEPRFSFTRNRRWKVQLRASPQELELLRLTKKFDHKVILHREWKEREWDDDDDRLRDIKKEETILLGHFAVRGKPLATFWTFPADNPKKIEEWEAEVTKRVKTVTMEMAVHIPPTTPTIEEKDWDAHALFVAMTGTGKTNAMRWRIDQLLQGVRDRSRTIILMEPKGVVSEELLRRADILDIEIAIIDPIDAAAAVNPFDKGDGSPQAINRTIDRLNRIFSLLTTGLSSFQTVVMQMAVRAMFESGKPAGMATLKEILRSGIEPDGLSPAVAEFFAKDFKPTGGKADTRAGEVINRLNGMLASPVFEALFSGETTFDMMTETAAGKLIVINANPLTIGGNPALYARYWIEEVAKTIYPRLALLRAGQTIIPVSFFIDEAGTYIEQDGALIDILARAREAKIGMVLGLQDMSDLTDTRLRNAVFTNTALKFAAHTNGEIHDLGRAMATEPEFFRQLRRYEFAFFGPNMPNATKVMFPLVEFSTMPQMTEEQYRELRRRNSERYGYRPNNVIDFPSDPFSQGGFDPPKRRRYNDK